MADDSDEIDARLAEALKESAARGMYVDREQLEQERRSAEAVARRARQICCEVGLESDVVIAAAIVADRLDDVHARLDNMQYCLIDIETQLGRRDR